MKFIVDFNGGLLKFLNEQVEETGNYQSKSEIVKDGLKRLYMSAIEHNLIKEVV